MVVSGAAARIAAIVWAKCSARRRRCRPVHRGDDDVLQAHLGHGVGHAGRFGGVQSLRRLAGGDVAERAGPRADVAHDHHGGVALAPALADVRTGGLLADRDQPLAFRYRGWRCSPPIPARGLSATAAWPAQACRGAIASRVTRAGPVHAVYDDGHGPKSALRPFRSSQYQRSCEALSLQGQDQTMRRLAFLAALISLLAACRGETAREGFARAASRRRWPDGSSRPRAGLGYVQTAAARLSAMGRRPARPGPAGQHPDRHGAGETAKPGSRPWPT